MEPKFIPFTYGRGRGLVWVCDVEGSTQYLANPADAGKLEEFLTRFMWVAQCATAAARGELIKFTGDGFLAWFELALHRDLSSKTKEVVEAIWQTSFLVNVTQLGMDPARKFRVRHGLTYEQDALYLMNSHPGNNSKDIIGEAVGRAFRLSGIPAKFPGIAADIQLAPCIDTYSSLGAFRRKVLTRDEVVRYFKGKSLGTRKILLTVQAPRRKQKPEAVQQEIRVAIAKAEDRTETPLRESQFMARFMQIFLNGPDWTKAVWDSHTKFVRDELLGTLKEILPLLEKRKEERGDADVPPAS